ERVVFSPDGKGLIALTARGVYWWNVATGNEVKQFNNGANRGGRAFNQGLAISKDGKTLFVGAAEQGTTRVWDVATTKGIGMLGKHPGVLSDIALSPDGKTLASCAEGAVHLWDVGTGEEIAFADGHQAKVISVAFSADGKTAASIARRGAIRRWDAVTGEGLGQLEIA